MDIEILLGLQQFREEAGSVLTDFMSAMTGFGGISIIMVLIAVIYWCISKSYGEYILMGWSGNRLLNGALKVTACTYRPWIRDVRIVPDAAAKTGATGYSFPSGHAMNAASVYGGIAIRRESGKGLRVLMWIILFLVVFSRIFLGVHTLQDIIAGTFFGILVMILTGKLLEWLKSHPDKDVWVALTGIGIAVAVAVFAALKAYPEDYDAKGRLIVSGAKMALDTFKGAGWSSAFFIGWILERRFIKFSTDITVINRVGRAAGGLLGYYAISLIVCPLIRSGLGGAAGALFSCFLQMFYIVFLFPLLLAVLHKEK